MIFAVVCSHRKVTSRVICGNIAIIYSINVTSVNVPSFELGELAKPERIAEIHSLMLEIL